MVVDIAVVEVDIAVVVVVVVVVDIAVVDIAVVVGGEADGVGWAWGVDTDMVRGGLIGRIYGTKDFTGHARTAVRALVTELGGVSTQEWDVMIAYSQMTVSGVEVAADGGR